MKLLGTFPPTYDDQDMSQYIRSWQPNGWWKRTAVHPPKLQLAARGAGGIVQLARSPEKRWWLTIPNTSCQHLSDCAALAGGVCCMLMRARSIMPSRQRFHKATLTAKAPCLPT